MFEVAAYNKARLAAFAGLALRARPSWRRYAPMKFKILLPIFVMSLSGCSAAIRDRDLIPAGGEGWSIANVRGVYQCPEHEISVSDIEVSRLFIAGPVIPLIPFAHDYPGYFSLKATNASSCPALELNGASFNSVKSNLHQETVSCQYKLGSLPRNKEINLKIKLNGEDCAVSPLNFQPKSSWNYCLYCSA